MPPPKPVSRPRQIFTGVLIILGVLVLAVVTSPWWWHLPARPLLAKQGITFARLESAGYKRFTLHDVVVKQAGFEATLASVSADAPLFWLQRAWFSQPGPVLIDRWHVRIIDNSPQKPNSPTTLNGWPDLRTQIEAIAPKLAQWLPEFRATSGTILAGKDPLTVRSVHWLAHDARVQLDDLHWRTHTANAEAHWNSATDRLSLTATSVTPDEWRLQLTANEKVAEAQLQLWGQTATGHARFAPTGWLPTEAELAAPSWELPASRFRLGAAYAKVSGEAFLSWKQDRFTTRLKAASQPLAEGDAPPLRIELSGDGDPQKLRFTVLDVSFPGTTAHLLSPIVLTREGRIESAKSRFSVEADLAKLPWPGATGRVTGEAVVEPDRAGKPHVTAHFEASDVNAQDVLIKKTTLDVELNGAQLQLKEAALTLADGSHFKLRGDWDWRTRTLSKGTVGGEIKAAGLTRWLPEGVTFSQLEIEAQAEGRWPELTHTGKLDVTKLQVSTVKPIALHATWKGAGLTLDPLGIEAKAGDTRLTTEGKLFREGFSLSTAELVLAGLQTLKLARPSEVRWQPELRVEKLELAGDSARIVATLQNGAAPRVELTIENVESVWLRDLRPADKLPWKIASLAFAGTWPGGALESTAQLKGQIEIGAGKNAQVELSARTDARGVQVERFLVSDERGPVAQAAGTVPLVINPAATPQWTLDPEAKWAVKFSTAPESAFWAAQAEATGVTLRAPAVTGEISGSLQKPKADLQIRADEIAFKKTQWPAITGLTGILSIDEEKIELRELSARATDQPFSAKGKTAYELVRWREMLRNPRLLWSDNAEVTIVVPPLQLSTLGGLLPAMLAPTGQFSGDVTLSGSRELKGKLNLKGAATHPVAPLGSVTEINSEAVFSGRRLELKTFTALAGGQPLKAAGWVEIPENGPLKIDFSLDGKNLHLARQAGLLIRGDVVLQAKTGDGDRTTVTGEVRLHDSLFLRDVRSLLPGRGGPGGAASRPPYFSVQKVPFNDWRLAVTVKGGRFLRLRTPLFSGVVSTDFQLSGTLAEPQAVGQATVDDGIVSLPFATFRVTSGTIRLTQADPYTPQLTMNAETRSLGYDLRMELTGSANDPALTFSSSPPLASEQVLLMVMAGETPSSEIAHSTTQRATAIGTYLGKSLFSGIFGGAGGSEKLTFSSGENVTQQGRETYLAEYALNPNWSVVGEYDEFDAYNIGFRRKIFAKKKTDQPEEKKP